jgi:hypothetical protein
MTVNFAESIFGVLKNQGIYVIQRGKNGVFIIVIIDSASQFSHGNKIRYGVIFQSCYSGLFFVTMINRLHNQQVEFNRFL